ncbi:GNAT family N-acetyltransferase [Gleimia sp. 6138-11-ORH1]|uniref:GNAT family N-acetyltransferase n=1 Tax=Gleimia sp. 6138-11-ORH1 TaxID=2973937 RepID=UPI002168F1D3|nr:GNAT family protein [Gleimia sp. 6138-11-ORH1]MCS4484962.1 GNAT family N-acetyltransferase [Gleimia sp. 6138-11-ORH1]
MWFQKILINLGFAPRQGWGKPSREYQLVIPNPVEAEEIKDPGYPVKYLWMQPVLGSFHQQVAALHAENTAWLSPWEVKPPPEYPAEVPTLAQYRRIQDWKFVKGESLNYLVYLDTEPVGVVSLTNIERGASQSATLGYWLAEAYTGLGIGRTAVREVIDFCFLELKLHRIDVYIRPENTASINLISSLPFKFEGVRENYLYIDRQWRDHRVYTAWAETWFE